MNNDHTEVLELPGFSLDLVQSALTDAQGQPVPLRPQSAAVLQLLGRHANQLVSKQTLMHEIWTDAVVTDDSLVQCIKEIRRALGDSQHQIIQTLPKHGYKLVVRPPSVEPAMTEPSRSMNQPAAPEPDTRPASSAPRRMRDQPQPLLILALLALLLLAGYLVSFG